MTLLLSIICTAQASELASESDSWRQFDKDNNRIFTASILAIRGPWLRIEIDKNDLVWARIDKIRKLPIHLLLYSLGFSMDEVNESILHSEFLDYSRLVYNKKQVKKRGKAGMSETERKELDNYYAQNGSFLFDMQIMLQTIPALFQKENV